MMLPVVTPHRRSAQPAGLQSVKQGSKTGSEYAGRRHLIDKAHLASTG